MLLVLQSNKEQLPPHLRGGWHFAKQNDWGSNNKTKTPSASLAFGSSLGEGAVDIRCKFVKSIIPTNYDLYVKLKPTFLA